jgi:hypothetical protein
MHGEYFMKLILTFVFILFVSINIQADEIQSYEKAMDNLALFSTRPLTSPNPPHHPFHPKLSTCTCFARHPSIRGDIGGVGSSRGLAHQNALANCFKKAELSNLKATKCQIVACTMC